MNDNELILVTGQSGVNVRTCLKRLGTGLEIVSVEDYIKKVSNISFKQFVGEPQYLQYECWRKAFDQVCAENKFSQPAFLTFHAAYYHQHKRELFSPVDFRMMAEQLKGKVRMILVLIDDIYDIYKRLMHPGEMYDWVLDSEQIKPEKAILYSIFNVVSLMNWREMEIALSRILARLLDVKMFIVATKYPVFMVKRLVEKPLQSLRIYYLSHPITAIRREARDYLTPFVGKLELVIQKLLSHQDIVLFYPTAIDELVIRRKEIPKGDEDFYYPELTPRWPLPYKDQLLHPALPPNLEGRNPLNPQGHPVSSHRSSSTANAISALLSLLWDYIHTKQIISRDYSLVEQSEHGLIVCRPRLEGVHARGVMGELKYNLRLMLSQDARGCFVFCCDEDRDKSIIRSLFKELRNNLVACPPGLDGCERDLIEKNYPVRKKGLDQIRQELEEGPLSDDYDFKDFQESRIWEGDPMRQKIERKSKIWATIHTRCLVDEIDELIDAPIRKRVFYEAYPEPQFWDGVLRCIDDKFK